MKRSTLLLVLLGTLALLGCEQAEVKMIRENGVTAAAEGGFGAEVTFCRRVGSKTGKRIGIDETFPVRDGRKYRYVYGFVDLTGVPAGDEHQVHLVWLKPDGTELFRRFGTVTVTPTGEGYRTQITWLDAEDLHKMNAEDPVTADAPTATFSSRINVDPDRERDLGAYTLKVYWNRELLTTRSFTLTADA